MRVVDVRLVVDRLLGALPADAEERVVEEDPAADVREREALLPARLGLGLAGARVLDPERVEERARVEGPDRDDARRDHGDDRGERERRGGRAGTRRPPQRAIPETAVVAPERTIPSRPESPPASPSRR